MRVALAPFAIAVFPLDFNRRGPRRDPPWFSLFTAFTAFYYNFTFKIFRYSYQNSHVIACHSNFCQKLITIPHLYNIPDSPQGYPCPSKTYTLAWLPSPQPNAPERFVKIRSSAITTPGSNSMGRNRKGIVTPHTGSGKSNPSIIKTLPYMVISGLSCQIPRPSQRSAQVCIKKSFRPPCHLQRNIEFPNSTYCELRYKPFAIAVFPLASKYSIIDDNQGCINNQDSPWPRTLWELGSIATVQPSHSLLKP